jgi:aspartyl protease family protein
MNRHGQWLLLFGLMLCVTVAAAVDKVQVLALFPGKAMLSIDGKRRVLASGNTSPEGVQLLSATPHEARVIFNGETRVLKLGSAVNTSYQKQRAREVHIVRDNAGSFVVNGAINGRSVSFLVDTGANVIAMSEIEARRLNIPYQASGRPATAATAGGKVKAWGVSLDTVNVGEISLNNIPAVVIQGENPPQTLLGMSFLGQLKMQQNRNLMTLIKR